MRTRTRLLAVLLLSAACGGGSDPSFDLKVPAGLELALGATANIDVTVERNGFAGELSLSAAAPGLDVKVDGLRVSVTAPRTAQPGKVTLTLTASGGGLEKKASVIIDVLAQVKTPTKAPGVTVTLSAMFYAPGELVRAVVDFGTLTPPATLPDLIVVSSESHDVEKLTLSPMSGAPGVFTTSSVPVAASAETGKTIDGSFTLPAGGLFFAMLPIDPSWPGFEQSEVATVSDFAWLDGERPGLPSVRVDPKLALSTDEATSVERPAGTLIHRDGPGAGKPVQVAVEELILMHEDDAELQRFLQASGGELLATQDVDGDVPHASLVKVNPANFPPARLALLRAFLEDGGELLASKPEAAGIYALALMFRLDGFLVSVNPRLQYLGAPAVRAPESTNLLPSMQMRGRVGGPACLPGTTGARRCATQAPALWTYLDLLDLDTRTVKVGVLDMGFAPNADFRTNPDGGIDQCDMSGRAPRCGPGTALGAPTVGNSLFGDRSWHGTGVVTTLGGIVDNGFGAAGTGGQLAVPMLYKYDLVAYAFDIGAGIRLAASQGASVINVSAGYPCTAVLSVGPDFDYCSIEGRVGVCAVVTAAAHTAAVAFCTSPAAGIPIAGAIACGALAGTAASATAACLSTLALGNLRAPMADAIQYAKRRGVPVVTSAGNRLDRDTVPPELRDIVDLSEQRVEAWGMIPATLPDVITVGAARESDLANDHFFGDRVDVWAPIRSAYLAPMSTDDPMSPLANDSIGGTSAAAPYVAGVVAAMQAVNPSLDPTRASDADKATAVTRVRNLLRDTALTNTDLVALGFANDTRRRNLVDPLRAVIEAGRGVQPDLDVLGYDTSLNFAEADVADDAVASARPITFGMPVEGTIFSFDPAAQDQDWKTFTMPTMTNRVFETTVSLRFVGDEAPTVTTSGGAALVFSGMTPMGAERVVTYRAVRASADVVRFAVTAPAGDDVPYRLTVSPPVALAPTLAIVDPVLAPGQTLCANRPQQFRAQGTYPGSSLTVSSVEWLIDGSLQPTTSLAPMFTRPVGTDTFTVRAFGATASITVTWVACTASVEILQPALAIDGYGMTGDPNGPYHAVIFRARALDAMGAVIDPATLVFEWTTNRADLQPGGPTSGVQVIGTGADIGTVRIYGLAPSVAETQIISVTVRASPGGPVLSTDTVQITIRSLI